jgi:hypothetical protein
MRSLGISRSILLAIFIALVATYAVTAPKNTVEAIDGYDYALAAETLSLNETHDTRSILFHKFNRIAYLTVSRIAPHGRAYELLRWPSILAAAGAVILFARLMVVGFQLTRTVAWLGAGLLGASCGFWRYGSEVEVYATSTFLILAILNIIIDAEQRYPDTLYGLAPAGLFGGLAASYYQPTAIALFVAMPVLLLSVRSVGRFFVYGSVGTAVVLLTLVSVYIAREGHVPNVSALLGFINERGSEFPAPNLSLWSFGQGSLAIAHNLVSSHWLYGFDVVTQWLASHVPQRYYRFEETIYAARQVKLFTRFALCAFALLGLLTLMVGRRAWLGRAPSRNKRLSLFMVTWFLIHAAITLVLDPSTEEPWIIATTPLIAIFTISIVAPACAASGTRLVIALLTCLTIVNYFGGVGIYADATGERRRHVMAYLEANARPGDVLVASSREHSDWVHARYRLGMTIVYASGTTARTFGIAPRRDIAAPTDALLAAFAADGREIYALDRALYPDNRVQVREGNLALQQAVNFAARWRTKAIEVASSPFGRVYRLTPTVSKAEP